MKARKAAGAFKSVFQFCEKVDLHLLNKRVVESLIKSGAMDAMGRRAQLMAVIDSAMDQALKAQKDAALGQHGLFGVFQDERNCQAAEKPLPNTPDWDEHERLAHEKEILGFFITGHPLEKYQRQAARLPCSLDHRGRRAEIVDRQRRDSDRRHSERHSRRQVEERRSLRTRAAGRHERLGRHAVLCRTLSPAGGEIEAYRPRAGEGRRARRGRFELQSS